LRRTSPVDGQGIDETIERRAARPRDDFHRRWLLRTDDTSQSLIERADNCLYAVKPGA